MFAIIAAVLFGLALIFDLASVDIGDIITSGNLTTAGLLFVALHLAVPTPGTFMRGRRGRR